MAYFTYNQNNSGGVFTTPAINLVVKADTAEQADAIALANGVYFDPEFEIDCDCCGNRWSEAWGDGEDTIPTVSEWDKAWADRDGIPAILVIE